MSTNHRVTLIFAIEVPEKRSGDFCEVFEDLMETLDDVELVATRKAGCGLDLRTIILDSPVADPACR